MSYWCAIDFPLRIYGTVKLCKIKLYYSFRICIICYIGRDIFRESIRKCGNRYERWSRRIRRGSPHYRRHLRRHVIKYLYEVYVTYHLIIYTVIYSVVFIAKIVGCSFKPVPEKWKGLINGNLFIRCKEHFIPLFRIVFEFLRGRKYIMSHPSS